MSAGHGVKELRQFKPGQNHGYFSLKRRVFIDLSLT